MRRFTRNPVCGTNLALTGPIHARIGALSRLRRGGLDPYLDPIRPRRAGLQRVGVARCAASRRAAQAVNEAANGQPRVRPFGYERGRRNPSDVADRPLRVIQERGAHRSRVLAHEMSVVRAQPRWFGDSVSTGANNCP